MADGDGGQPPHLPNWALEPCIEISPEKLVPKDRATDAQSLFLALAVAFNDLKGIALWDQYLADNRPTEGHSAEYRGQWAGLALQNRKLTCGMLHELLKLLKEFDAILDGPEIQRLLKRLPSHSKKQWRELVAIAREKDEDVDTTFARVLVKIRNNVSFHYYQPKLLVRGFQRHFYQQLSTPETRYAAASLGQNLEGTRFYFGDAAVQQALEIQSEDLENDLKAELRRGIRRVLDALGNLLNEYASRAFKSA